MPEIEETEREYLQERRLLAEERIRELASSWKETDQRERFWLEAARPLMETKADEDEYQSRETGQEPFVPEKRLLYELIWAWKRSQHYTAESKSRGWKDGQKRMQLYLQELLIECYLMEQNQAEGQELQETLYWFFVDYCEEYFQLRLSDLERAWEDGPWLPVYGSISGLFFGKRYAQQLRQTVIGLRETEYAKRSSAYFRDAALHMKQSIQSPHDDGLCFLWNENKKNCLMELAQWLLNN